MEKGYCVKENGDNQDSGVIQLNSLDGSTPEAQQECLELCQSEKGATGCEIDYDNGCYAHTQEIVRGNGEDRKECWVFSKCKGRIITKASPYLI